MDRDTLYTAVLLAIGDIPHYEDGYSKLEYDKREKWRDDFARITGQPRELNPELGFSRWLTRKERSIDDNTT